MKIKTLGHIFLANKLRSAILKTTPGRRAGGVRGGGGVDKILKWLSDVPNNHPYLPLGLSIAALIGSIGVPILRIFLA